jgi:hypothetical protein
VAKWTIPNRDNRSSTVLVVKLLRAFGGCLGTKRR